MLHASGIAGAGYRLPEATESLSCSTPGVVSLAADIRIPTASRRILRQAIERGATARWRTTLSIWCEDASGIGVAAIVRAGIVVIAGEATAAGAGTTATHVGRGAGIAVVTPHRVIGMGTAAGRDAAIVSADIGVVAIGRTTSTTLLVSANISCGACISIIAWCGVCSVHTTLVGVTAIVGAEVGIVAVLSSRTIANPSQTDVRRGTEITVVAGRVIGHIDAATFGNAAIVGADISVIAVQRHSAFALTQFAEILGRTGAAVITGHSIQLVSASGNRMAVIGCTDVVVIAILSLDRQAFAVAAMITNGARVAVIAPRIVGRVDTCPGVITTVIGARVGIIALLLETWLTESLAAEIVLRAWVVVRTRCVNILVLATASRQTDILGARIAVVTLQGTLSQANTRGANISGSTGVTIITFCLIGRVSTALLGMAGIVGAGVPIVAIQCGPGDTATQ